MHCGLTIVLDTIITRENVSAIVVIRRWILSLRDIEFQLELEDKKLQQLTSISGKNLTPAFVHDAATFASSSCNFVSRALLKLSTSSFNVAAIECAPARGIFEKK